MKYRFCKQCYEMAVATNTLEKLQRLVREGKLKPPCPHAKMECCKIIQTGRDA